jgi:NAD(P)-dependent dehydrogenase (short-subunit alcohol dehydrogenase family)
MFSLEEKVVLVAGGTGAIGTEIARAASAYGAKVAVSGRSVAEASGIATQIAASSVETVGVAIDVTDTLSISKAVTSVEHNLGQQSRHVSRAQPGTNRRARQRRWNPH